MLQALPLVFALAGLALYTVLAGADFGAGLWQLLAGRGAHAARVRAHAHDSMAPVWEANHVWLIFVLTVLWTAYPRAFASIASTLAVPLFIAAIGIVFRGAAYALRSGASGPREAGAIDTVFSISSILTPFALGAAVGGVAARRVPVGNAAGHLFSSWTGPISIFLGMLSLASCGYLAAVFLAADAARLGEEALERAFRTRALGAGVIAGALALAGLFVVNGDSHELSHSLLSGNARAAVVASFIAGLATLALVYGRRYEAARYGAAIAVATLIAGWALAQWPTLLPGLTVRQAAAGHDVLVGVVACVLGGAVLLFPALALLFRLTLTGHLQAGGHASSDIAALGARGVRTHLFARGALACLIAALGFLTVAEASWAHAVGVACLFAFVVTAFLAITLEGVVRDSFGP